MTNQANTSRCFRAGPFAVPLPPSIVLIALRLWRGTHGWRSCRISWLTCSPTWKAWKVFALPSGIEEGHGSGDLAAQCLPAVTTAAKVLHQTPGRIRLGVPRLKLDDTYANRLQCLLESVDNVRSIRISVSAASVVVHFSPEIPEMEFARKLEKTVAEGVIALRSVLHSYFPGLNWIHGYRKEWLRTDEEYSGDWFQSCPPGSKIIKIPEGDWFGF